MRKPSVEDEIGSAAGVDVAAGVLLYFSSHFSIVSLLLSAEAYTRVSSAQ